MPKNKIVVKQSFKYIMLTVSTDVGNEYELFHHKMTFIGKRVGSKMSLCSQEIPWQNSEFWGHLTYLLS